MVVWFPWNVFWYQIMLEFNEIGLQKKVDLNFVYPLAENYDHVV
jgi:hypothetical protein